MYRGGLPVDFSGCVLQRKHIRGQNIDRENLGASSDSLG